MHTLNPDCTHIAPRPRARPCVVAHWAPCRGPIWPCRGSRHYLNWRAVSQCLGMPCHSPPPPRHYTKFASRYNSYCARCAPCPAHCAPCPAHCAPCPAHCAPCPAHCAPCPAHCRASHSALAPYRRALLRCIAAPGTLCRDTRHVPPVIIQPIVSRHTPAARLRARAITCPARKPAVL